MLVITRKVGETIIIGDNIEVKVARVDGGQVRLAITAPREIPVHRGEIYARILAEREQEERPA